MLPFALNNTHVTPFFMLFLIPPFFVPEITPYSLSSARMRVYAILWGFSEC